MVVRSSISLIIAGRIGEEVSASTGLGVTHQKKRFSLLLLLWKKSTGVTSRAAILSKEGCRPPLATCSYWQSFLLLLFPTTSSSQESSGRSHPPYPEKIEEEYFKGVTFGRRVSSNYYFILIRYYDAPPPCSDTCWVLIE